MTSSKIDGSTPGNGHADAVCRYVVRRGFGPERTYCCLAADSCYLRRQRIGRRNRVVHASQTGKQNSGDLRSYLS